AVRFPALLSVFLMGLLILVDGAYAWSNGGYSDNPLEPDYGTHDWIAEHALDWLPANEKAYIINNLEAYLYGTELPDNPNPSDGIGDTKNHHIYFSKTEALLDDSAAIRAQQEYVKAINLLRENKLVVAAKTAGIMSHYIADMAVFGHVMGAETDWGEENHHDDYESYVNARTNSYNDDFNVYLSFDGSLDEISAYDAAVRLAYDTVFDVDGDLTCVWMDQNYNWNNKVFRDRCGESLNLAVNLIADVLHTLYVESSTVSPSPTPPPKQTPSPTPTATPIITPAATPTPPKPEPTQTPTSTPSTLPAPATPRIIATGALAAIIALAIVFFIIVRRRRR
ncbi:MAG: zinc dependent phospholipase C family protein, partial [Candidatus Bathyarchaeia archaeon]